MTKHEIEELILEVAQLALDEPWSDVQGRAEVIARELAQ